MMEKKRLRGILNSLYKSIFICHMLMFVVLYLVFPRLINYPKFFNLISFQIKIIKIPLIVYFIAIGIFTYIIEFFIIKKLQKNINSLIEANEESTNNYKRVVIKAREDCMSIPYKFIVMQVVFLIFFVLISIIIFFGIGKIFIPNISVLVNSIMKIILITIATWLMLVFCKYILLKKYLSSIIEETYKNNYYYRKPVLRIRTISVFLMQIIPILITIFIFSICFSYSNTINIISNNISEYYKVFLNNINLDNPYLEDTSLLLKKLSDSIPLMHNEDFLFIIDENDNVKTLNNEKISEFMISYKNEYFLRSNDDEAILYEAYGIDEHAFIKRIQQSNGKDIYIGVKYFAGNKDAFKSLTISGFVFFSIYSIILICWAKDNSNNIKKLEENMKQIFQEKNIIKKNFMPILSNDEMGNISYYYNKIQDKIDIQNELMVKQEQLSILGELAGGMAHDINTPISSIKTSIIMLEKYCNDPKYVEIIETMSISADRILNLVNTMRNQIRNLGSNAKEYFELKQLVDDIHVLTQSEQKKNGCVFESEINERIIIYGERLKLGQVLTNIVINGIQAYGRTG